MHHDNGPLGAASIDRAETRRVELLKANGAASTLAHRAPCTAHSAPRTAHSALLRTTAHYVPVAALLRLSPHARLVSLACTALSPPARRVQRDPHLAQPGVACLPRGV